MSSDEVPYNRSNYEEIETVSGLNARNTRETRADDRYNDSGGLKAVDCEESTNSATATTYHYHYHHHYCYYYNYYY